MARVTLRMPAWAKELGAFDFDVDCWDTLARKQLAASEETWETLDIGHVLAVEDRESFSKPWPGNRRFVWILDDEQLVLFDEHGAVLHEEDESPDGCVSRGTFDREFAGNKGDYYRIPPESSVRDCTATYVDLAAAYGGMGRRSITGREDRLAAAWFAGAAARAGIPAGSSTFCS